MYCTLNFVKWDIINSKIRQIDQFVTFTKKCSGLTLLIPKGTYIDFSSDKDNFIGILWRKKQKLIKFQDYNYKSDAQELMFESK